MSLRFRWLLGLRRRYDLSAYIREVEDAWRAAPIPSPKARRLFRRLRRLEDLNGSVFESEIPF